MFKCKNCGKEAKSKAGLKAHERKCISEESLEIKKLEFIIANCRSAEAKHHYEMELLEFKKSLK